MESKNIFKILFVILRVVIGCAIVGVVAQIFIAGMFLTDFPKAEEVQQVVVTKLETGETVTLTSEENIRTAVKARHYLRYSLLGEVPKDAEPVVQVDYILKDGTVRTAAVGYDYSWWNGKGYQLRTSTMYVLSMLTLFT